MCNSPWPTFMMIFMDLVLQTPPSLFSNPSCVPLEVAVEREREREGLGDCRGELGLDL